MVRGAMIPCEILSVGGNDDPDRDLGCGLYSVKKALYVALTYRYVYTGKILLPPFLNISHIVF
jgi:hypothetical protein